MKLIAVYLLSLILFSDLIKASGSSLTLRECLQQVLKNNLDLNAQRAKLERTRLATFDPLVSYLPKVDLNWGRARDFSRNFVEIEGSDFPTWLRSDQTYNTLSLQISETLDLNGTVWREHKNAKRTFEISVLQMESLETELISKVVYLYYEYHAAVDKTKQSELEKAKLEKLLARVRDLRRVGYEREAAVIEVEYNLAKVELDVQSSQQNEMDVLAKMSLLVFGSQKSKLQLQKEDSGLPYFMQNWRETLQKSEGREAEMISMTPSIRAAKAQLKVSDNSRAEKYFDLLPKFSFIAQHARDYSRYSNQESPSESNQTTTFAIAANWNLFAGGKDYLTLKKQAQAKFEEEQFLIKSNIEGQILLKQAAEKTQTRHNLWRVSQKVRRGAELRYASKKAQYDLGKLSITDLLEAQVDDWKARSAYTLEKYEFYKSYVTWLARSGLAREKLLKEF